MTGPQRELTAEAWRRLLGEHAPLIRAVLLATVGATDLDRALERLGDELHRDAAGLGDLGDELDRTLFDELDHLRVELERLTTSALDRLAAP